MNETEMIPYASLKRENDIDDSETIVYASPKGEQIKLMKKYIKKQNLKLPLRLKNKLQRTKKIIKSELEQNKVDIQVAKESDVEKVRDVFDEVKKEEPINVENFFIGDNDIFDSEKISNPDREFIIDLINRANFIVDAKRFVEESNALKMELVHPEKKN